MSDNKLQVTGEFEVSLIPQEDQEAPAGRMLINKTYQGSLSGIGVGQMISKRTESGTAVYTAIEEFSGQLGELKGGFTLVHSGKMSPQEQMLNIEIIEGSGHGELAGIEGNMEIIIEQGKHSYVLDYAINN